MTGTHPRNPEEQAADLAMAMRWCRLEVDNWFLENRSALDVLPPATQVSMTVQAALGYLIGHGFITLTADPPYRLPHTIPEHLAPDVNAEIVRVHEMVRGMLEEAQAAGERAAEQQAEPPPGTVQYRITGRVVGDPDFPDDLRSD